MTLLNGEESLKSLDFLAVVVFQDVKKVLTSNCILQCYDIHKLCSLQLKFHLIVTISNLLKVYIMKGWCILSNAFSASLEMK